MRQEKGGNTQKAITIFTKLNSYTLQQVKYVRYYTVILRYMCCYRILQCTRLLQAKKPNHTHTLTALALLPNYSIQLIQGITFFFKPGIQFHNKIFMLLYNRQVRL